MSWEVIQGDCIERMAEKEEASVDAVVCDPPYGIGFMGHEWDQPGEARADRRRQSAPNFRERKGDHTRTRERSASMHAGEYDLSLARGQAIREQVMALNRKGPRTDAAPPADVVWRRPQTSLLEPSGELFNGTWPRSGMCAGGTVYSLPPLAPRTSVTGSSPSLLLPTPAAADGERASKAYGRGNPTLIGSLLPTPRARVDKEHTADGQHWGELRASIELLPTPHGFAKEGQKRRPGPSGNELGVALRRAATGASTPRPSPDGSKSPAPLLNPSFVEWMLGLPEGWSDPDCPLSATEFRSRLASSSAGESSNTSGGS